MRNMASGAGKENIADGLVAGLSFGKTTQLSPRKSSRKTRSKSIGPGGLDALEETALKESSGNRRKVSKSGCLLSIATIANTAQSAFIPAVKSILASNDEDEKKRRRKSLARRRVSFAPEATLHTWDVVEYVRDATTSSASSEGARRESSTSEATSHTAPSPRFADTEADNERASTPPQNVDGSEGEVGSSPANQRDLHQKKYRRSSGIPPMNFNNPDDVYSSSPISGDDSSPIAGDITANLSDEVEDAAKIDGSLDSNGTSESSARLDAALRQATAHAGTQQLHLGSNEDDDGDVSMDIAEDEITTSFKPWAAKADQAHSSAPDNRDPFAGIIPPSALEEADAEDVTMDITRAIGGIVQQAEPGSSDVEDMSMDLTVPLGVIKSMNTQQQANRRKSLKRRASLFESSQGSPAKRPASRRTSLRQRTGTDDGSPAQDATMDFTVAIGTIKGAVPPAPQASPRRNSVDSSFGEETMDFTVAIGGIKNTQSALGEGEDVSSSDAEDMSMEFTRVVGGGIKNLSKQTTPPKDPTLQLQDSPRKNNAANPRKSPDRPRFSEAKEAAPRLSPPKSLSTTPKKAPAQARPSPVGTPVIPPPSEQIERFEPSPFVRHPPASLALNPGSLATPTRTSPQAPHEDIPLDPITAPILNRRRSSLSSVQFSPLAPAKEEPTQKSSALLSNIKLLSTPRKQTLMSPSKRGLTPKKSQTPQKAATPQRQTPTPKRGITRKSLSPKKRVAFGDDSTAENTEGQDAEEVPGEDEPQDDVDRISLQEFLDMTKIRFMDLSTTKRRHTVAPSSFHDKEVDEEELSLDRYVVAAACTLPEYELYQHACHEMKKYISDGRHFVRTMEANVLEENPVLFTEYLTAPPDQRIVMDNQFKNLKTSARLDARGEWYGWRSTLLRDLKSGLLSTMEGFLRDESVLKEQEKHLDATLPPLVQRHEQLSAQCKQLQQRHDELNSCDREELEQIRERLVTADAGLAEKRKLLAQLQEELSSKEARIEAVKERKVECAAEIKAAERVREECRGWSTKEVTELKGMFTCSMMHFLL